MNEDKPTLYNESQLWPKEGISQDIRCGERTQHASYETPNAMIDSISAIENLLLQPMF